MVWKVKSNSTHRDEKNLFLKEEAAAVLWESLTINHLLSPVIYLHCLLGRWYPREFNLASQRFHGLLIISRILSKIHGEANWTGMTDCPPKTVSLPEGQSLTFSFFSLSFLFTALLNMNAIYFHRFIQSSFIGFFLFFPFFSRIWIPKITKLLYMRIYERFRILSLGFFLAITRK